MYLVLLLFPYFCFFLWDRGRGGSRRIEAVARGNVSNSNLADHMIPKDNANTTSLRHSLRALPKVVVKYTTYLVWALTYQYVLHVVVYVGVLEREGVLAHLSYCALLP